MEPINVEGGSGIWAWAVAPATRSERGRAARASDRNIKSMGERKTVT
jgi:hypothetical protein